MVLLAAAADVARWLGQQSFATRSRRSDEAVRHAPAVERNWWGRIESQHLDETGSGVTDPRIDGSVAAMQIGHTWMPTPATEVGVYGALGWGRLDGSGYDRGLVSHAAGRLDADAGGVGAYAQHAWDSGLWVGAVAQTERVKIKSQVDDSGSTGTSRGWNLGFLAEGGWRLALAPAVSLEPFAQASVQRVWLGEANILNSDVAFSPDSAWTVRGGARVGWVVATAGAIWQPYVEASLSHRSEAADRVSFSVPAATTTLEHRFGGSAWDFRVGGRVEAGRWAAHAALGRWQQNSGDARLLGGEVAFSYRW